MQWITVATPPFESLGRFDKVLAETGGEPDGLEARYVGKAGNELRIVTLWETKAHADRFFAETLGPALAKALGPVRVTNLPKNICALGISEQRAGSYLPVPASAGVGTAKELPASRPLRSSLWSRRW